MNDSDHAETEPGAVHTPLLAGNQAYIKKVSMDGTVGYGIHAPDGRLLGVVPDRDIAPSPPPASTG